MQIVILASKARLFFVQEGNGHSTPKLPWNNIEGHGLLGSITHTRSNTPMLL